MFFQMVVSTTLALGAILIIAGVVIALVIAKGGDNVISVKIGKKEAEFRGREAALFAVLGSALVLAAVYLMSTGGTDSRPSPDGPDRGRLRLSAPVYAQNQSAEVPMASNHWEDGWVYLGPENDPDEWVFKPLPSVTTDTDDMLAYGSVVHAIGPAFVREAHGSDFFGTILAIFFAEPRSIGTVSEGDCARVMDREEVGFGSLWIKVEETDCPE